MKELGSKGLGSSKFETRKHRTRGESRQLTGLSLLVRRQNRVRRVEWIRTVLSVGVNQEYVKSLVLETKCQEKRKSLEWKYQQTLQVLNYKCSLIRGRVRPSQTSHLEVHLISKILKVPWVPVLDGCGV